jgi:hypothetical protein
VEVSPSNGGHVTSNGVRLFPYPAYKSLMPDEEVALEPVPALGYRFDGWIGSVSSSDRLLYIKAGKDRSLTANFSRRVPDWLIAVITAAVVIPLLLRWRMRGSRLKRALRRE